ncbi:MAG TPA: hypothetical protein VKT77_07065 [Chthonomonadaceae bacterium]|nr:hypothetical protein [Chthonomonadaceae bacterium]
MANEEIIITIARPQVGIEYHAPTSEAELGDRRAAVDLALHALAQHAIGLRQQQGMPVPEELEALVNSDLWRAGM